MELSLASGSLLDSPAGSAPGVSLSASAGLRMASSGPMATPRTRTAMTMTTRTSTGSFFSTVVPIRDGVLGERLDCPRLSSARLVTSSETDTSPGRRANTPADAGLTRCARLRPRAVQPSRFVRPQPVYPATGRRAASGGFARSGPGPSLCSNCGTCSTRVGAGSRGAAALTSRGHERHHASQEQLRWNGLRCKASWGPTCWGSSMACKGSGVQIPSAPPPHQRRSARSCPKAKERGHGGCDLLGDSWRTTLTAMAKRASMTATRRACISGVVCR
jgi:hypothetical protein